MSNMGESSQVEDTRSNSGGAFGAGSMAAPASTGKTQESIVKHFANLLGTKSASQVQSKALMALLSPSVTNQDVVLILPTLDLQVEESTMPNVGEHRSKTMTQVTEGETPVTSDSRPTMEASVLASAAEEVSAKEQKEAETLRDETQWTKSTLVYASGAVSTNLVNSFTSRVDSRIRAWTLLLLKHSLSTGDSESRSRLLRMLSASIKVNSADISFKTLSLPDAASGKPKEEDVILPLLFEAVLHVTIQDRPESVTLRAPGTISAKFSSNMLANVEIRLDTRVMLTSMSDQARVVVFKAVASATKTPLPPDAVATLRGNIKEDIPSHPTPNINASALAGFKSALNLSPSLTDQSPRLQKARSSALRLNGVLHGKQTVESPSALLGMRKIRSVKWDTPAQLPKFNLTPALAPAPKKQRVAQNAAKLKSFKSFGRAHAGDFGSGPRNATFGEYGGRQPFWGRDGRLLNHPSARQAEDPSDQLGMTAIAEKNATFDMLKPRRPAPVMAVTGSLPRTATALESWLVKESTNGKMVLR